MSVLGFPSVVLSNDCVGVCPSTRYDMISGVIGVKCYFNRILVLLIQFSVSPNKRF